MNLVSYFKPPGLNPLRVIVSVSRYGEPLLGATVAITIDGQEYALSDLGGGYYTICALGMFDGPSSPAAVITARAGDGIGTATLPINAGSATGTSYGCPSPIPTPTPNTTLDFALLLYHKPGGASPLRVKVRVNHAGAPVSGAAVTITINGQSYALADRGNGIYANCAVGIFGGPSFNSPSSVITASNGAARGSLPVSGGISLGASLPCP